MLVKALEAGAVITDAAGNRTGEIVSVSDEQFTVRYISDALTSAQPRTASVEAFEAYGIAGEEQ